MRSEQQLSGQRKGLDQVQFIQRQKAGLYKKKGVSV
jgi:hypothetical protein